MNLLLQAVAGRMFGAGMQVQEWNTGEHALVSVSDNGACHRTRQSGGAARKPHHPAKRLNGSLNGRAIGLFGTKRRRQIDADQHAARVSHTSSGHCPHIRRRHTASGTQPATADRLYARERFVHRRHESAVRFVRMMAELSGLPPGEALERAHEAFYYVGLGEARYRNLGTYSLGMKQLAKLAQAIAHGPKLLFLDEPTNGLDPAARVRMIRLIREVRDTKQVNMIISSHLLRDVEECCEEVADSEGRPDCGNCNLEEERRANLNFIEMEVLEGTGGFQDGIDRLGCDYAALGQGRYKMVLREGVAVKDLYRIAAERDAQIRKLSHRQDSLEDIFLKAMEN